MLEIPYRAWNKNRSKLSEFPSEPFAEEKTLGIPFPGTKIEANFQNFVPKHLAEENPLSVLFFWNRNLSF
jgi:hypothetical protein